MKNQLIKGILFTLLVSPILAESSADKLVAFHNLTSKHKIEWNNFHKNLVLQKKNLENEIVNDWNSFKNKNVKSLAKSNFNEDFKESFFNQKLNNAVTLHKKHMNKWATLMKNEQQNAHKLALKQYAELAKFEGKEQFKYLPSERGALKKDWNYFKDYFSGKKKPAKVTDEEIKALDVNTPQ